MTFPSLSDVEVAQKRIENYVFRTPIIESPDVNSQLGFRLLLKICLLYTSDAADE